MFLFNESDLYSRAHSHWLFRDSYIINYPLLSVSLGSWQWLSPRAYNCECRGSVAQFAGSSQHAEKESQWLREICWGITEAEGSASSKERPKSEMIMKGTLQTKVALLGDNALQIGSSHQIWANSGLGKRPRPLANKA